jgi:class 3 adenylate cyclase
MLRTLSEIKSIRAPHGPKYIMSAYSFEQPFPILRPFLRYILPGVAFLLVISAALAAAGARILAEGVYLEQATRRAQTIDRAMNEAVPEPWRRLKSGETPHSLYRDGDGQRLLAELTREARELDLTHLKIYAASGTIQFSTDRDKIGTSDRSPAFVAASERGVNSAVYRVDADGSALYELYVLIAVSNASPVIFELYEPVEHLTTLLWRAGVAAALVPVMLLLTLMLGMSRLIVLAQRNINSRAALVTELRARLERLLSGAASQAMRHAISADGRIPTVRTRCTLLYSDIRDFTSFSEVHEPEQVVSLLNQTMTIMVDAISRSGGDVDKMIGDAVLARFQGKSAEARAIAAAREALRAISLAQIPRGVGIGIYTGDVISGPIGPPDRMDFTVIGDSVNIAARLCSVAIQSEIVADFDTVRAAGDKEFSAAEPIAVKGRHSCVNVCRWRC